MTKPIRAVMTNQAVIRPRTTWPEEAGALAAAEREAVDGARHLAETPVRFWRFARPELRQAVAEILDGWEAHWPDAATRPPEVGAVIRAFREGSN